MMKNNNDTLFTIPNILTLIRVILIPVLVIVFYLPLPKAHIICSFIFIAAALTDWLDGYLARTLQQQSAFGKFLDPVADKLMVAVALVLLVAADPKDPSPFIAIPAAIIIGREIVISALREWMAELGQSTKVAVSMLGKIKTSAQMTAISLLLYHENLWGIPIFWIGLVLLQIAALLTLISMGFYLKAAWPYLRKHNNS